MAGVANEETVRSIKLNFRSWPIAVSTICECSSLLRPDTCPVLTRIPSLSESGGFPNETYNTN